MEEKVVPLELGKVTLISVLRRKPRETAIQILQYSIPERTQWMQCSKYYQEFPFQEQPGLGLLDTNCPPFTAASRLINLSSSLVHRSAA